MLAEAWSLVLPGVRTRAGRSSIQYPSSLRKNEISNGYDWIRMGCHVSRIQPLCDSNAEGAPGVHPSLFSSTGLVCPTEAMILLELSEKKCAQHFALSVL
ncbi:hypothetical protein Y032_0830g2572 [Ancylostoma ceylanicum]|uniref:Uncharacterized protein n=1 Tax=Ancylostoma ceylanicum TaxID=53326 RepID=A0A016WBW2_9BILA|nr:hypothetical protein Y032_0830g2572 [Ancylostoma ceylanicum]